MKRVANLIRCAALTVAVAVATFLVAPAGVQAHPGHGHDLTYSATPNPVPAVDIHHQQNTGYELFAATDAGATTTSAFPTISHGTWLQAGSGHDPANGCSHGSSCCQCAPCGHGHFALPAAHETTAVPPLATPPLIAVLAQPGIEPGALPEPPKSFIR